MSYLDRVRSCTYTDPNGTIHALFFDEVSRSGEKKAGVFEFPHQDRTEVQDLGMVGTRIPLTVYITGENYDQSADALFSGLSLIHTDSKAGTLQHPRWGDIKVKPLTFDQNESFVDGMGRATFQIQFVQIDPTAKFPTTEVSKESEIKTEAVSTAETIIGAFLGPKTAKDIVIVANQAVDTFNKIQAGLSTIASQSDEIASDLAAGVTEAIDIIGDLVATPESLADTVVRLTRIPAVADGYIIEKVKAYLSLFTNIVADVTSGTATDSKMLSLSLSASAMAAAEATTVGTLYNRNDAVAASDLMAELLAYYQSMMDTIEPNPDMVSQTVNILTMAQGYLLEASFGLKSARRKILEKDSDPITVTWELYHDILMLDQFCADNDLQEGEFFVLPMGREVVWYA